MPEDELQEALTASEMVDAVSAWADAVTVPEVLECVAEILSEEEHKVFDDVFINGYTIQETASRQHISFDKARGKVSSIRKKIKKYFSTLCLFIIIMRCMK